MKEYADDRELVSAILAGKRRAFEILVKRYERLVYHVLVPFCRNAEDRVDVSQDVFVKVYQNLGGFQFRSKLSTWIGNIAYNTAVNFKAKQGSTWVSKVGVTVAQIREKDPESGRSTDLIRDESPLPDEVLIKQEGNEMLARAIDQLPEIQKSVLILFHKEEIGLEEISAMLELPVNTVKSHLFRARRKLKELLLHNKG